MDYIDTLIDNCQKAKTAECKEFIMNDPSDLKGIKCAVYIIKQEGGDPNETFTYFSNHKKISNKPSPILYVGSSRTSLKTRISQHIGKRTGKGLTYALYLDDWFNGEFGGKYEIIIKEYEENTPPAVLQIIEDALAYELKPAFGKSGGNNK